MIKFTIKNLEIFIEVVENASFSLAAEILGMTQSSVSIAINTLEKSIGVQLLERNGRKRIELTNAGELLYPSIKQIVEKGKEVQNIFHGRQDAEPLMIGTVAVLSHCFLPQVFHQFQVEYPECRFVLEQGDSERVHELLNRKSSRIGFVANQKFPLDYTYVPLFKDSYVFVTSSSERFRKMKERGSFGEDLLNEPLVIGYDQTLVKLIRKMDLDYGQLKVSVRVKNLAALKEMVMNDVGVALLPIRAVKKEIENGSMISFPLKNHGMERIYYITYPNDTKLMPMEQAFVSFISNRYRIQINDERRM